MSKTTVLLLALALVPLAHACGFTYTHDGGLKPMHMHGRHLMADESSDGAAANGADNDASTNGNATYGTSCNWDHVAAGRDWPDMDEQCGWTCAGESQSPINVPLVADAMLTRDLKADLNFGTATDVRVLNLGYAVQVEFSPPADNNASVPVAGDSIYNMYNGIDLDNVQRIKIEPLQFHFHATSEHLVSGKSTMLEFHLVTRLVPTPGVTMPKECPEGSDELCLAVFGVLYDLQPGDEMTEGDPLMQQILDNLPACDEAGKNCIQEVPNWELELASFFPDTNYHAYSGSLTTPPCSQGVMWHVFPKVQATLSEEQAIDMQLALSTSWNNGEMAKYRLNNRVVVPLNNRNVFAAW